LSQSSLGRMPREVDGNASLGRRRVRKRKRAGKKDEVEGASKRRLTTVREKDARVTRPLLRPQSRIIRERNGRKRFRYVYVYVFTGVPPRSTRPVNTLKRSGPAKRVLFIIIIIIIIGVTKNVGRNIVWTPFNGLYIRNDFGVCDYV